jgi:hypothetical protein
MAQKESRLEQVIEEFERIASEFPDVNPVRTDLLMRLVCLKAAGGEVDYPSLVMLSGYGTSFAYHPQKFWVMYSPPDTPDETEKRLMEGTGFGWEWRPKVNGAEEAWQTVKETVDSGNPVQGRWLDDYLFVGYQEALQPDERKVYALGGWREPGWMSWDVFSEWAKDFGTCGRPTGPVSKTPEGDMVRTLLQRTVAWSCNDGRATVEWMQDGAFGRAGLEAYAADVADLTKGPDFFNGGWLGCHCVNRQASGRQCAASYTVFS